MSNPVGDGSWRVKKRPRGFEATEIGLTSPRWQDENPDLFSPFKGEASGKYIILYGNRAAKAPVYETDLKYGGAGPAWMLENSKLKVVLSAAAPVTGSHTNRHGLIVAWTS